MNYRQLVVGPETARMFDLGHPWVIADRYTRNWTGVKAGEIVSLVDESGRLQGTALVDPRDRVVARVLEFAPLKFGVAWIAGKLEAAWRLRKACIDREETNAFRLVNGEGDGLPGVTVDCYGDYLMVQLYAPSWKPHLPLLVQALEKVCSPAGIYEKHRPQKTRQLEAASDTKKYSRLLAGRGHSGRLQVRENGLSFLVDLEEGLNTGLFLDQRVNRQDLMGRLAGKRFLNLFAYTGAFSVAAAAAGASRVTSVDTSRYYLDWAAENFAVNRLNPKRHPFVVEDCYVALRQMQSAKEEFDVILMDPPSFSTTKKSRHTTRGGSAELVAAALPLLAPGGMLICSSNHQKVDLADYLKELRRGALQAGVTLQVVRVAGQPEDFPYTLSFPEGRYLKFVMTVKG